MTREILHALMDAAALAAFIATVCVWSLLATSHLPQVMP